MRPTVLTVASPLFYTESGGGDPVVLLHGLGADHRVWDPILPALNANWRVFTPDLPGHGRSSLPDRPIDLDLYARSVARWLDGLGMARVRIVGHSLGAAVAATLAIERANLVRSLVLINPVLLTAERPTEGVVKAFRRFGFARLLGKPPAGETRRFLERGLGLPAAILTPDLVEHWRETIHVANKPLEAFTRELRVPAANLPSEIGRVTCPVTLLWGERDALFPGATAAAAVAARLRRAANEFAEVAHLPMAERPADMADWLDKRLHTEPEPTE